MKPYMIALLAFLVLANLSIAGTRFSVGVSPSVVTLDNVESGSGKIVNFYIVTIYDDPLLVNLQAEQGSIDFFQAGYATFLVNYSEQDVSSWAQFFNNPVELIPATTGDTSTLKGWREIDFLVDVPRNAEPGYHLLNVKPLPTVPEESVGGEAGTMLVAVTSLNVLFNVPGEAKREGVILDTNAENGYISTYFKNTGTVTISATASQKIYDESGKHIADWRSPKELLIPGETRVFRNRFSSIGKYTVSTTVNYITGSAFRNSTVVVAAITGMVAGKEETPWLTILIILIAIISIILIAIFIYRRTS